MIEILSQSLRTGLVTTPYPDLQVDQIPNFKGRRTPGDSLCCLSTARRHAFGDRPSFPESGNSTQENLQCGPIASVGRSVRGLRLPWRDFRLQLCLTEWNRPSAACRGIRFRLSTAVTYLTHGILLTIGRLGEKLN
jgi:hypothetical protein